MRLFVLIISVCLIMSNSVNATAAGFSRVGTFGFTWEGIFTSGRLSALGGSDLSDGSPSTLMVNPSPLSRGNGVEVSYDHANYFADLEYSTIAGTAEWNNFRINFAEQKFYSTDTLIRTAYNPEGTGETFDFWSKMTLFGASYDLGKGLIDHPSLQWSVGMTFRHYSSVYLDSNLYVKSYDLGTSLSWTLDYQSGWTRLTGTVSKQNLSDPTIVYDDRESYMLQPLRIGMTVETAFDRRNHPGHYLNLMMAYTRSYLESDYYISDSEHFGMEAVFYDIAALRMGHSTRVSGDITSWGVGLILDRDYLGPYSIHVDLGSMGYDSIFVDESYMIWGVRVGYEF